MLLALMQAIYFPCLKPREQLGGILIRGARQHDIGHDNGPLP